MGCSQTTDISTPSAPSTIKCPRRERCNTYQVCTTLSAFRTAFLAALFRYKNALPPYNSTASGCYDNNKKKNFADLKSTKGEQQKRRNYLQHRPHQVTRAAGSGHDSFRVSVRATVHAWSCMIRHCLHCLLRAYKGLGGWQDRTRVVCAVYIPGPLKGYSVPKQDRTCVGHAVYIPEPKEGYTAPKQDHACVVCVVYIPGPQEGYTAPKQDHTCVVFFSFLFFILRRMGQNKAQAHHTSTYFHTRRVSIELSCFRNPTVAGASFGSHCSDSVSCFYQRSSLQPRQRKLPLYTDAFVCNVNFCCCYCRIRLYQRQNLVRDHRTGSDNSELKQTGKTLAWDRRVSFTSVSRLLP